MVGVSDDHWGEAIGAFIQRTEKSKAETELGKKEVKIWLRNKIAPHKIPDYFFWIGETEGVPNEIPVNATGKIVKKELGAIADSLVKGKEVH